MGDEENILIDYINKERHSYLNDLQVILGYAQLGKSERVINYVHKIIKDLDDERKIFKSNDVNIILEYIRNKNT